MAKRKPEIYKGPRKWSAGRSATSVRAGPSFTMKPGTPMPQAMHPAIRKAEFDIAKYKKGLAQRQAAKKAGSAVVEYTPPKTAKPTAPAAPTPSPTPTTPKKPKTKPGIIGRSGIGRLLRGQTGRRMQRAAAGKGLIRGLAPKALGFVLRRATPAATVYYGVRGGIDTGIAAYQGVKALKLKAEERSMAKRSKAKYGTIAAATRTRKAMTGK